MSDPCQSCGQCCRNQPTPPFLTLEEIGALPHSLEEEILQYVYSDRFSDADHCLWLKGNRCQHYDLRPMICRHYQVGCEGCRKMRAKIGLSNEGLPDIKDGDE
jgi:Fe-S-cluster containining protein